MSIFNDEIIIRAPIFIEKEEENVSTKAEQQLSLFSDSPQSNRSDDYCPETSFFSETLPNVWNDTKNDYRTIEPKFYFPERSRTTGSIVNGTITEHFSLGDVLFCLLTGVILSVIMFGSLFLFIGAVL